MAGYMTNDCDYPVEMSRKTDQLPGWLSEKSPAVADLVIAARKASGEVAEATKETLTEAIKAVHFERRNGVDFASWGDDAVERGRDGEPLSSRDWAALEVCVQAQRRMQEAEERSGNAG